MENKETGMERKETGAEPVGTGGKLPLEKTYTAAEDAGAGTEPAEEHPYLVVFRKPVDFEGVCYKSVDLSGLEDLSAADMIAVNRAMERGGTVNVLPEMSLEYACLISSRASGLPVEFFKGLPPREALKVKNRVTNFLYGED